MKVIYDSYKMILAHVDKLLDEAQSKEGVQIYKPIE